MLGAARRSSARFRPVMEGRAGLRCSARGAALAACPGAARRRRPAAARIRIEADGVRRDRLAAGPRAAVRPADPGRAPAFLAGRADTTPSVVDARILERLRLAGPSRPGLHPGPGPAGLTPRLVETLLDAAAAATGPAARRVLSALPSRTGPRSRHRGWACSGSSPPPPLPCAPSRPRLRTGVGPAGGGAGAKQARTDEAPQKKKKKAPSRAPPSRSGPHTDPPPPMPSTSRMWRSSCSSRARPSA